MFQQFPAVINHTQIISDLGHLPGWAFFATVCLVGVVCRIPFLVCGLVAGAAALTPMVDNPHLSGFVSQYPLAPWGIALLLLLAIGVLRKIFSLFQSGEGAETKSSSTGFALFLLVTLGTAALYGFSWSEKFGEIRNGVVIVLACLSLVGLLGSSLKLLRAGAFFASWIVLLLFIGQAHQEPKVKDKTGSSSKGMMEQMIESRPSINSLSVGDIRAHEIAIFADRILKNIRYAGKMILNEINSDERIAFSKPESRFR